MDFFKKTSISIAGKESLWYNLAGGLFFIMLAILPSVNSSSFTLSTTIPKTLFFLYGLMLVMAISSFGFLVSGCKKITLKWSKVDIVVLSILAYIILNRYLLQSYHGFSIRYIELIGLSLSYVLLRRLPTNIYPWLFLGIVVSGIIQAIYGCLQLLGYYPTLNSSFGVTGSFLNPGPYAGFLSVAWAVAFLLFIFKEELDTFLIFQQGKLIRFKQFLFTNIPLVGLISITVVMPTTRSRAAWLSVLASIVIVLIYKYRIWKRIKVLPSIKKIGVAAVLAIIFIVGFLGAYQFKKGSVDGRILIWKAASGILKENIVFGVGFDRFKAHYMNAQADYFEENGEKGEVFVADNSYHAFNEPLQFLVENGLVGFSLLAMLALFIVQLKPIRRLSILKIGALTVLMSIFVFGLFSYPAQILSIKLIGTLTLSFLAGIDSNTFLLFGPKNQNKIRKHGIQATKFSLALVCIFLILPIYIRLGKIGKAYKDWKIALEIYNYGAYKDSTVLFETAYPILNKEGDFLMGYGKSLAMAQQPKKAMVTLQEAQKYLNNTIIETTLGDVKKELGRYREAEIAYQHAANMIPSRFYPHYLLARLYNESGQLEKARKKALEIMDKEVKIPSTAIEEMKREMNIILKKSPGI